MCFSATASFAAGAFLLGVGTLTLRSASTPRELPFAAIPLLFAIQQLSEGVIWLTFSYEAPLLNAVMTHIYSFFSHVLWPIYVPVAVLLIEPPGWRRRALLVLVAAGVAVGAYLLYFLVGFTIVSRPVGQHIEYVSPHFFAAMAITLYVMSTTFSPILSTHRTVKVFGALALLAFAAAYYFYAIWFISVWCFFAALLSMVIYLHFVLRRAERGVPHMLGTIAFGRSTENRLSGHSSKEASTMNTPNTAKAYIVGGGIASLSAAVLLIRDGGFRGQNIRIIEELQVAGGALDGSGDLEKGYVTRGGRMFTEETYVCLWNVLQSVPSLDDPAKSVKDQVWAFNDEWRGDSRARLIDKHHRILDAKDLGFNLHDRLELMRLLVTPERSLGTKRIEDCFSPHFFETNFWAMWRTTFAFQNWHSAIELKRYMLRFLQEFPRIHTLAGVRRTALNQYDSVVRPTEKWLADQGVVFDYGTKVTDIDFLEGDDGRRVQTLHGIRDGKDVSYAVGPHDYAFITIGSMSADSRNGDDDHAASLVRDKRDGAWTLWENMARKAPGFGRPYAFSGNVDESKWESFTLTMRSPLLVERIVAFSGNQPGTGGLMTFRDSSWLMSIVVPHPPHFAGQPDGVFTLWGYGLFVDNKGDYIDKSMAQASGKEILTELMHHLGFEDILDEVRRTTTVIPVMMPYITSQFQRRDVADRPPVIPDGAKNYALLGQYVEIPEDVVFTVEYSVRAAMHGVYGLLGLKNEIPPIYHGIADPRVGFAALKTLVG